MPANFGKYVLTRLIATGGMAEIFLAHEKSNPGEPFVIKRILPHLVESSEFVSMFLDEARIAAQLHHENIVEIYDVGRIEGAYFIAMEYVHGEDIRRIYNQAFKLQRSLPLSHSIRVIAEAAVGLGFAHRLPGLTGKPLGVVHRDVSPQNILVTYDGSAKIVDFGIAKAASKVSETRAGVLKGKYSYMSPEQATGDPLDHRTDIFALGIILYETTTGTRLFKRQNELATLQAIMRCEFKPPSDVLKGYPLELEQILLKALAMDVRDRYQDAEDFSRDLFQFLRNSGLHVERSDISAFMHELFEPSEAHVSTAEIQRPRRELLQSRQDTALERKDTKTQMEHPHLALAVEEVAERDAVQRNQTLTKAEKNRISVDVEETQAQDAEDISAAIEAPGFVDGTGFSTSGDTVAESYIHDIEDRAARGRVSGLLADHENPVAAAAYGNRQPAKDEIATVAVARAYRDPVRSQKAAPPPERDIPTRQGGLSAIRKTGPSPKLVIGVASMVIGVLAIVWMLLDRTPEAPIDSTVKTKTPVLAQEPKPELKPIASKASSSETNHGKVEIRTQPKAVIMLKDEVLGTADAEGRAGPFKLPAGRARLRSSLSERGFERFLTVYVKAGQEHQIKMEARKAKLLIKANPESRMELNGTPQSLNGESVVVDEGSHHLLIQNTKLKKSYESMIRISAGEQKVVEIDLLRVGEDM